MEPIVSWGPHTVFDSVNCVKGLLVELTRMSRWPCATRWRAAGLALILTTPPFSLPLLCCHLSSLLCPIKLKKAPNQRNLLQPLKCLLFPSRRLFHRQPIRQSSSIYDDVMMLKRLLWWPPMTPSLIYTEMQTFENNWIIVQHNSLCTDTHWAFIESKESIKHS